MTQRTHPSSSFHTLSLCEQMTSLLPSLYVHTRNKFYEECQGGLEDKKVTTCKQDNEDKGKQPAGTSNFRLLSFFETGSGLAFLNEQVVGGEDWVYKQKGVGRSFGSEKQSGRNDSTRTRYNNKKA